MSFISYYYFIMYVCIFIFHNIIKIIFKNYILLLLFSESYLVPSGTLVYISIHDIHRDSNFWPNPDVFDPDRFLSEKIQNRHPYSYLPFSAGPRNCIGSI